MAKYQLIRAIAGGDKPAVVGELIELTEEQAAHPLYANRVRSVVEVDKEETGKVTPPAAKR